MTSPRGDVPTRADVARRAQVSPALVSYVLNGGPRKVSDAARGRIEKAIAELGYRPNMSARTLRGGTSRAIGLLTPSPVNGFLAELAEALETYLFEHGNILMMGVTRNEPERERRYIESFIDHSVDGFFLISGRSLENVQAISTSAAPVVVLDAVSQEPASGGHTASWVHVDNRRGAFDGTKHLISHGHTLIGCIGGAAESVLAKARVAGWRDALESSGITAQLTFLENVEFTEVEGFQAALRLLTQPTRPSALFVSSDVQAIGVLHACDHLQLRVPEDLAIVSFDGSRAGALERPSLTSLSQPIDDIAKAAVDHLLAAVGNPELEALHLEFPGELRIGQSCGCAPHGSILA